MHFFENITYPNKNQNKNLSTIEKKLIEHQKLLSNLKCDEIILIFREAAKLWKKDSYLEKYKYDGLDFIINWILSGKLEKNLNFSLRGTRHHLDDFVFYPELNKKLIALPRGIVTHWLAGNVPTLGIISLLSSIVCKNANIIKISDNSLDVLIRMLNIISNIEISSVSGKKISGKIINNANLSPIHFQRLKSK